MVVYKILPEDKLLSSKKFEEVVNHHEILKDSLCLCLDGAEQVVAITIIDHRWS